MKIDFENNLYFVKSGNNRYYKKYQSAPKDTVSFKNTSQIPQSAVKYLNIKKQYFHQMGLDMYFLSLFDAKNLEGLQNGIKILENVSFEKIVLLTERLRGIITANGCNQGCIHCFANALNLYEMKKNNFETHIDFEDYENFCNGFKELNSRLGFNAFPFSHRGLFYDSDSSMIYLKDSNNKTYDYADLAKMFNEATGSIVLFDTSGWNINDKKTQARMEDLVQKIVNSNEYDFIKFNISINPFHSIYSKSVELKEKGNIEKSKKLREIYTDRMANTIFTFSPLINRIIPETAEVQLNFILRSLYNPTDLRGYKEDDLRGLCHEIVEKIENMYDNDLASGNLKVVKSEEQKNEYLRYIYLFLINPHASHINICNDKLIKKLGDIPSVEYQNMAQNSYNSAEAGKSFDDGFIDLNGRFYLTNYVETYPTNIVLNYKNKNKQTAPIAPNLRNKIINI